MSISPLLLSCFVIATVVSGLQAATISSQRVVFQTKFGDIEFGFFPEVAPITSKHILLLSKLGAYNTNHFFRVDKGFVAQTHDVRSGRVLPLDEKQKAEADKNVPLEVSKDVKHDRKGLLSMGRLDDPNSGGSSFSIMLGPAPHLDMKYTIFGEVTRGLEVLDKMQEVATVTEGIFVKPKERIDIMSSYVYKAGDTGEKRRRRRRKRKGGRGGKRASRNHDDLP